MKRCAFAAALFCTAAFFLAFSALAAEPVFPVSETYRTSVYYERLTDVELTGNYRTDLVSVALSQVGYHEGDGMEDLAGGKTAGENNYVEYGTGYYGNYGVEWCAEFASWCARQAGIPEYVFPSACRAASDGGSGAGEYVFHCNIRWRDDYTPTPGDLIFFSSSGYGTDHVGIVAEVTEDGLYTVEGNSQNAVRVRYYDRHSSYIVYYGVFTALPPEENSLRPLRTRLLQFAVPEDLSVSIEDRKAIRPFALLYGRELQLPSGLICRDGSAAAGYYVRRQSDGAWFSDKMVWVSAVQIRMGLAAPLLLEDGGELCGSDAWFAGEGNLELHCVWRDAAGGMTPDETADELRRQSDERYAAACRLCLTQVSLAVRQSGTGLLNRLFGGSVSQWTQAMQIIFSLTQA